MYLILLHRKKERFRIYFVTIPIFLAYIGKTYAFDINYNTGYYGTFATCLILIVMALVYGKLFLKEKPLPNVDGNLVLEVFNPKTVVVDTLNVFLQKRVAHRGFLLIMSYICYILIKGLTEVQKEEMRYYLRNVRKWSLKKKIKFTTFETTVKPVGMFIAILLFTKKLKMNDYFIAIICCVLEKIASICYGFGTDDIIWFAPVIDSFSGLYEVALRLVIIKLMNPSEIAKSQALLGVCEALHPVIIEQMFAEYLSSVNSLKSYKIFFLLMSGLLIVPLILLFVMYFLYKYDLKHPQPEEQQDVHQDGIEQCNNDIEMKHL